jgi:hypothetical protein
MLHVIVEGRGDGAVVEALLADLRERHPFAVTAAGGRDLGRPLARKLLALEQAPVAFVFDTDVSDPEASADVIASLQGYFNLMTPDLPLELVPMAPSIEALLTEHATFLERRLGRALSRDESIAARLAPKQFLQAHADELKAATLEDLMSGLRPEELDILRQDERIARLRRFVEKHGQARAGQAA